MYTAKRIIASVLFSWVFIVSCAGQNEGRKHSQYFVGYGPCFPSGSFSDHSRTYNELGKGQTGYIIKVAADKFIKEHFFAGISFERTENKVHNDTLTATIQRARNVPKEISKNTENYFELGISRIGLSVGMHGNVNRIIFQAKVNAALCLSDYSFSGTFYIPDSVSGSPVVIGYPRGTVFRYSGNAKPALTLVPELSLSYPVVKMERSELRVLVGASYFLSKPTIQVYETIDNSGLGAMINPPAEELFRLKDQLSFLTINAGFSLILKKK